MNLLQDNTKALEYNRAIVGHLNDICAPLFDNFLVNGFGYAKFYKDGRCLDLFTHMPWQEHYFENFDCSEIIINDLQFMSTNKTSTVLWGNSVIEREDAVVNASYQYDLWHGMRIYEQHNDYIECWHFTSSIENFQIVNLYITHGDLFKRFIHYFKEKSKHIIKTDNNLSVLNKNVFDYIPTLSDESFQEAKFLSGIKIDKFKINIDGKEINISKREAECIEHISNNRTFKETANLMAISPRTVEYYIRNIKQKTNCFNSRSLVNMFSKSSTKWWGSY